MPAIDRYDGVLYEGLDAATLTAAAARVRGRARRDRVGAVRAAVRARPDPGVPALARFAAARHSRCGRLWRAPVSAVLARTRRA